MKTADGALDDLDADRRIAEQLQDRWRRDRQTARALREHLLLDAVEPGQD